MHYNVEGRQLFGVRWQSGRAQRRHRFGRSGATGHSRMVVVYPMDSSVRPHDGHARLPPRVTVPQPGNRTRHRQQKRQF